MTVAFDTLKFAQALRGKAKGPQDQAEGMGPVFADATSEQIATKSDLKQTELRLEAKIADARSESIPIKWTIGVVLAFRVAIFFRLFCTKPRERHALRRSQAGAFFAVGATRLAVMAGLVPAIHVGVRSAR